MRFVIVGVGAIGGTLAVRLTQADYPVVAVARGVQLQAIRDKGLTVINREGATHAQPEVRDSVEGIDVRADDVLILATRSGGTQAALLALRDAGYLEQPIFCFQNGIDNERLAARFFDNAYAVSVHLPAVFRKPGEIVVFGAPVDGIFDIGRFGGGVDAHLLRVAEAFRHAGFGVDPRVDIGRSKFKKLLGNIPNIVDALFLHAEDRLSWRKAALDEAEKVLAAHGFDWEEQDPYGRGELAEVVIAGYDRVGSSTLQGLARGASSIETEYLNGEIVLLGRQAGIDTPVNARLVRLSRAAFAGRLALGSLRNEQARDY